MSIPQARPSSPPDVRRSSENGDGVPLVRPSVPDPSRVARDVESILRSGILTNGPYVRDLEARAADYLGVAHCVAVASCTSGLMLVLRAADLSGDVIVPSFTFAATAHAVVWNGLRPVFAEIDRDGLMLSPEGVLRAIGVRTSAVLATHLFGAPCDVERLAAVAASHGIRLFFDAAHAFGARRGGVPVGGFGDAEVFSLSPTKVLVAGEGGIIATNDGSIAERCRIGRDYGNPGDYDCRFVGLNARMSEIHAAVALASLSDLEQRIERRNELAERYRKALADVDGISFPWIREGDRSTFKDFTILVDAATFGIDADALARALAAVGIETRRYYSPPVHTMRAYRRPGSIPPHLPETEWAASRSLTLPLWPAMSEIQQEQVIQAIHRIGRYVGGGAA